MKLISLLSVVFLSPALLADTLTCVWQNDSRYEEAYFRPSQFDLVLHKERAQITAQIVNDTYFERYYEPCWTGNWESCRFSFGHDTRKSWEVEQLSSTRIVLHQDYSWFYARLELSFSRPPAALSQGDQVSLLMEGDDGDGTFIRRDRFLCTAR